jgi:acyl-CoA synthetase (AMP-forming)/AMP-acid ligase II
MRPRLVVRIVRTLWRVGLLRVSLGQALRLLVAWWRCGSSFAVLAAFAAARFPDRLALVDEEGALTFAQLVARSTALAASLRTAHGLGPGHEVALLSGNHRGFVIGLVALSRLGVDVLVLGTESPPRVLGRTLAGLPLALVLHDPQLAPLLAEAPPALRRQAIALDAAPGPSLPRVRRRGRLVLLTSGSSGIAKRIPRGLSLRSVLPALAGLLEGLPLELHRPTVLAIPLHHGYGLTTLAMTLAMSAPLHLGRRHEVTPLLARLPAGAAAVLVTVPTLLHRWLRHDQRPPAGLLAAIITGSAPLDAGLCTQLLDACGPILFNLYGSTEAGVIAMATPAALRARPGTVGRPLPGTTVRLLDAAGVPVPPGHIGRIQVKGPLVLQAGAGGWFDTRDLGRLAPDGNLDICGRADRMFVSGGQNVYPQETEAVLLSHPAVSDAAVTVVDDAELGQRMQAWVVPRAPEALDDASLRAWLRERLDRHKLPREIHLVASLPRTELGKVDRAALAVR